MKSHQDNFMVGGQHNMRDCIKGFSIRKVKNHCCKAFRLHSSLFILICPKLPQQFGYPATFFSPNTC